MWTCILFDFLLQPCKVALCLFPLDRLSFPVIQNLFQFHSPTSPSSMTLTFRINSVFCLLWPHSILCGSFIVIIAHPEVPSACFSIPHQRWTLCHSCVHPYSAQQRFLHKEQDKQKSVELTVLIWGKRRKKFSNSFENKGTVLNKEQQAIILCL